MTSLPTNHRSDLINGERYTIVNVNKEKTYGKIEEIVYKRGMRIKRDFITFYITGHHETSGQFVNQCLGVKIF